MNKRKTTRAESRDFKASFKPGQSDCNLATLGTNKDGASKKKFNAMRYQTSIVDLTELKRSEQTLRESEALLSAVMKQLPVGLGVMDIQGRWIISNAIMNQFVPKGISSVISERANRWRAYDEHGRQIPRDEWPSQRALRGEVVDGLEMIFTDDDGRDRLVRVSTAPLLNDAGAIIGATAIVQDITDRKRAEEAVRQSEMKLTRELADAKKLQQISSRLIRQEKIEAIYEQIVGAAIAFLGADAGSLQMLTTEPVQLRLLASKGFDPLSVNAWKCLPVFAGTVCAEALRRRERVIVPDIRKSGFLKDKIQLAAFRKSGIRAVQSTPLISRTGQLVGMMSNHWRTVHHPSERELRLIDVLARQAADLIERTQTNEKVRESEERMRATVEQATAGVARCDLNGRITFVNRKFCQMLGYEKSELIGKSIADVTHRADVTRNMRHFQQMIRDGKPFEIEKRYVCKDGSILWADVSASAVHGSDGKTRSTVAVIVDITRRKRAEAALQKANAFLENRVRERTRDLRVANMELEGEIERRKGLEGEILAVSDREQQRLGQELHDGLCQHLTAVAFMARSISLRLRDHRVVDASDIEKVAELVNQAAVDTRNLSRALHRVDVDAAGLVTALQDLVDREIWRTPCRLEVRPSFRIDNDFAAGHLYRIAREAVINANKHAQAREIVVKLERSRKRMVLRVVDDGVGVPNERGLMRGLGFHIMKYRAQLIGGCLEIEAPKTRGTEISLYLPEQKPKSRVTHADG
jgi:PAS domain S-box-containing protein